MKNTMLFNTYRAKLSRQQQLMGKWLLVAFCTARRRAVPALSESDSDAASRRPGGFGECFAKATGPRPHITRLGPEHNGCAYL